ncbi:MAG TPA: class I SAM-dependent methyltransferase [Geminicoccus sp.]|uniref:class I SAM-dependent methyltransferase n=1 Tax=Geminicoccus sp. TaxID=2024832 RepID=UPI002CB51D89|nr:class I SAM-dependent methyltransferase [Geminicoccus sp.]HWL69445.1 class I SAM-dependent methyltransferase [Geminicoccus sp.]
MVKDSADSVAFYDRNAERFATDTGGLDLSPLYECFLRYVPLGGRILDAGCGVGRDALAFAGRGYSVVAFDASAEMVRLAEERVAGRAEVLQMRFEDAAWREEFDGIWACASLLHVPSAAFSDAAARLAGALRPGGAWHMSFKLGWGERTTKGRLFVDHTEETLRTALAGVPIELREVWTSEDTRPGRRGERWLNVVALKQQPGIPL